MRKDEMRNYAAALMMQGLLYHCAACVLFNIVSAKTWQENLWLLLLYIPLFLFAFIREKCGNFVIFILLHALISGILLLAVPDSEMRTALGCCAAAMALSSVRLRLKPAYERRECPPIAAVCLFFIVYLAASDMNRPQLLQISYYETFLFLILAAVYRSLANTSEFLKLNAGIHNLPSRQIKSLNKMLSGIFILALTAGMLVLQHLPVNFVQDGIGRALRIILRGIVSVFLWLFNRKTGVEESGSVDEGIMPPLEAGETSMLAQILDYILMTVIYLLLAAGALYFVVRVVYELYKRFYEQQKPEADESEFLWKSPQIKERAAKIRGKKEYQEGGSANQKIRRIYKKYIRRQFGRKAVIPSSLTPAELEGCIKAQKPESKKGYINVQKLPEPEKNASVFKTAQDIEISENGQECQHLFLYEKARYSQWECSKQDVDTMNMKTPHV